MKAMTLQRIAGFLAVSAATVVLSGCKHHPPKPPPPEPPPPVYFLNTEIVVGPDSNPDSQGRPSPVVLRFYKLKDDESFKSSDFYALFDKEQATLSGSLIAREEFELSPGERRSESIELPKDLHVVGVVAAYRNILNAAWRAEAVVPVKPPEKNAKQIFVNVNIRVDRARVSIGAQ
jgi:type VI secretion system protein VasD